MGDGQDDRVRRECPRSPRDLEALGPAAATLFARQRVRTSTPAPGPAPGRPAADHVAQRRAVDSDIAGAGVAEQPLLDTNAPSPATLSGPTLSVGSAIRSHRLSIARGLWWWRRARRPASACRQRHGPGRAPTRRGPPLRARATTGGGSAAALRRGARAPAAGRGGASRAGARPGLQHRDLEAALELDAGRRRRSARAALGRRYSSAGRRAGRCRLEAVALEGVRGAAEAQPDID